MGNHVLLTIIILLVISLLFFLSYINAKKIPIRKKKLLFEKLSLLQDQIFSDDVFARRDAIIRLDNLLSKSLQIKYKNDNKCGDNLKLAKQVFSKKDYQSIWDVHKLRNEIVHKDIDISTKEAKDAFKIYKMGINKILK